MVHSIVLTGGPCGGKTSGLARIEQELTDKGYKVFTLDESATRLITGGADIKDLGADMFQRFSLRNQLSTEALYMNIANNLSCESKSYKGVILLHDRGLNDGLAFVGRNVFKKLVMSEGLTLNEARDRYDAVFHLTTCAKGVEEYYTLENNKARSEGLELAKELDTKLISAWVGHSHLRVIANKSKVFEEKMNNLMQEIYRYLGEPVPMEIERKYLIEKPDLVDLQKEFACTKVEIIQTYLVELNEGVERRIRQRGCDGSYTYFYTEKQNVGNDGLCRSEEERKISKDEYMTLLMEADTKLHQIRKDRYCFEYNNQYFELDVYPFWDNCAVMEIELTEITTEVDLPEYIKVIKDVTEDKRFKNKGLAKTLGLLDL